MKVKFISRSEESLEDHDYRDKLEIHVDGKQRFHVSDGEPEDANLGRDFNDCMNIDTLMEEAYQAGVRGEPMEILWENE